MKVSYNGLKEYLGEDFKLTPEAVAELLTFHAFEIEEIKAEKNDTLIDVKVLPDRASDCLSHVGIAREIAVILGQNLAKDPIREIFNLEATKKINLTLEATEKCPRFMLALVEGIEIKESPDWLKEFLATVGQRSVNNVVDITNYVMLALGQPLHAYDADLIKENSDGFEIVVREAKAGEMIYLLPEKMGEEVRVVNLEAGDLIVVDKLSNEPLSLAGIKGGNKTAVSKNTKRIILEAGNFSAETIRQTSKRLRIDTEAVKRFENNPTPFLVHGAIKLAIDLLKDLANGDFKGSKEAGPAYRNLTTVDLHLEKINALSGLSLSKEKTKEILERFCYEVTETDKGFRVIAPPERTDLELEENYIDDIVRIYGLHNIKSLPPKLETIEKNQVELFQEVLREKLTELGFSEIITSTFSKKDEVKLANSLASDKSFLRSSLLPALKDALKKNVQNLDVLGLKEIKLFEIGTVFSFADKKEIKEELRLALGVMSKKTGYTPKDDVKLSEVLEKLKTNSFIKDFTVKEGVAEITLDFMPDLDFKTLSKKQPTTKSEIIYQPFSLFPAITRDIAFWTEREIDKNSMAETLKAKAGELCFRVDLFDQFKKDNRESLAYRLVFQASDRTLTDEEVEKIMVEVYSFIEKSGFEIR